MSSLVPSDDPTDVSTAPSAQDLRPDLGTLVGFSIAVAAVSALTLPWAVAIASTTLGILMIAGADVDARSFLLPDTVTWGALVFGFLVAWVLNPSEPMLGVAAAVGRAAGVATIVAFLRWSYANLRGHEGLGMGDVKLSAGVGAWLPLDFIPLCFCLATVAALAAVLLAESPGRITCRATKVPLGAFLCPALWFVFYISVSKEISLPLAFK